MNKLQKLVCKIFKIERMMVRPVINKAKECEMVISPNILDKPELLAVIENQISVNDSIVTIGINKEVTAIRQVKLASKSKSKLEKTTLVIEIEEMEWD